MVEVHEEITRIEEEVAVLSCMDDDWALERISELYERMEELDAATAETRAAEILHGLGEFILNELINHILSPKSIQKYIYIFT